MAIRPFLAMTAAEIRGTETLPPKTAWMACHFSPYSTGLSNLPKALPPGSMVILDDITPIHGHDSETIAAQLRPRLDALKCSGVLLDFQRPGYEEAELLAGRLSEALPCPVGQGEHILVDGLPGLVAQSLRLGVVGVEHLAFPQHGAGAQALHPVFPGQVLQALPQPPCPRRRSFQAGTGTKSCTAIIKSTRTRTAHASPCSAPRRTWMPC